ncbi:MAG: hypothetical protein M1829_005664 [Trizodia sp. TS-e1964]|nr:MAG: hypothetical protein M1829_005664 [Trizodia sp. TS-e1964]
MDNLIEAGQGHFPLETWFWEMPVCTRVWTTAAVVTSILVQCHVITPWQLYYSFRTVFVKSQYWRLLTNFIYFGPPSIDLVFHIFFLQRYSRLIEMSSGPSPAHFSWLLLYATTTLIVLSPLTSMAFLGSSLSSTLVYIWSRRNPDTLLSFFGLVTFTAPYLPWVLMAFSLVINSNVPKNEIMGVIVGHVWYFFSDLYPVDSNGSRPLDPPAWWCRLFEGRRETEAAAIDNEIAATTATDLR